MAIKNKREPFSARFKESVKKWLGVQQSVNQAVQEAAISMTTNKSKTAMNEFWTWYIGTSERLIDFYKMFIAGDTGRENYFWAVSAWENNKKTHSGLPRSIVTTLCNVSGIPEFSLNRETEEEIGESMMEQRNAWFDDAEARMNAIIDFNDLRNIIKQDARPKTLVIGGGAFIVSDLRTVDPSLDKPIIEYVDERDCDIMTVGNIFIGIERRVHYTRDKDGKRFILHERRTYNKIENILMDAVSNSQVPLSELPETSHLQPEQILTIDAIPAVPLRYKNGYRSYGLSIFDGKLDMFDSFDQVCSQLDELVRTSTPITYIDASFFEKKNGQRVPPKTFRRHFQTVEPSVDQKGERAFKTEQPALNYDGLINTGTWIMMQCITGIVSASSLGIETQRRDNAEAMREKEKVTLVTRDDIIDNEKTALKHLLELCMKIYDLMQGIKTQPYDIAVDYADFASPTFEQVAATLLPLWANGALSPEQFAKLLHTDTLTEEDMAKEIEWLKKQKEIAVPSFNDLYNENEDGNPDIPQEEEDKPEDIEKK